MGEGADLRDAGSWVQRAKITFGEISPLGRLLNRFVGWLHRRLELRELHLLFTDLTENAVRRIKFLEFDWVRMGSGYL